MLCSHKKPLHDIVIKAESHSLTTQAELYEDNIWEIEKNMIPASDE